LAHFKNILFLWQKGSKIFLYFKQFLKKKDLKGDKIELSVPNQYVWQSSIIETNQINY